LCPTCGAEFSPDAALKPRRSRAAPDAKKPAAVAVVEAVTEPAVADDAVASDDALAPEDEVLAKIETDDDVSDDGDDSVIEDTSDLGGEDDGGIGTVAEKVIGEET
jgi:hypothetical protein